MKDRFRSPVVWATVIAQVCLIIYLFNPNATEPFKIVATALVEILTAFGILNNPTDKTSF